MKVKFIGVKIQGEDVSEILTRSNLATFSRVGLIIVPHTMSQPETQLVTCVFYRIERISNKGKTELESKFGTSRIPITVTISMP